MKIFNWLQKKNQGNPASIAKKPVNPFSSTITLNNHVGHRDYSTAESSDWWPASGLLAIGTFGLNKNLQVKEADNQQDTTISPDIICNLPQEEVLKMSEKDCSMIEDVDSDYEQVVGSRDLIPGRQDEDCYGDMSKVECCISFALSRGVKSNDTCKKKSLTHIFKKMYAKGFSLSPGLKHPLPESRIDKILRAILHKKIYPQSSSATVKKCLKNKPPTATEVNSSDSKWIKTDSDYIVLEM